MKLRLGTRGSDLALTQSGTVAEQLRAAGFAVELTIIRTEGDRSMAPSFGTIGAQGVFVREIEQALLNDEIELAVHSFKDLPTASPDGLRIAAVPPRVDAADILILRASGEPAAVAGQPDGQSENRQMSSVIIGQLPSARITAGGPSPATRSADFLSLAHGARVGTSSVRRGVWLKHFRPDLKVEPLRGNVPTRIRKLRDGEYDAIVLAAAGVARLSAGGATLDAPLHGLATIRLDPRRFVSAPAQGALAVQCRDDRADVCAALAALDDAPTRASVTIEREALRRAEGGCNTAFGAYCVADGNGGYELTAMLERDARVLRVVARGESPDAVAEDLWRRIEGEQ